MLLFFGTDLEIHCVLLDAAPEEDNASSFEDVALDGPMFMLSLLDDPVAEETLCTLDAVGDGSVLMPVAVRFLL